VRKDIERGLKAPAYGPRKPWQAVIDPFTAYLRERVARYPDPTGSRLFRELIVVAARPSLTPPARRI